MDKQTSGSRLAGDRPQLNLSCHPQGQHPKHKGISDPNLLGTVERYFLQVMDIPRLKQRIQAFIFSRSFPSTLNRV